MKKIYLLLLLFSFGFMNVLLAQSVSGLNPGPALLAGGPMAVGDTICSGDSTFVYLVPEPNKTYTWYDAMTGGNLLGSGDTLYTGPLTSTTTYYMQGQDSGAASFTVGPADNTIASGSNYTYQPDGLVFSVAQTCTIDSIFVYPNGPGNVVINIENSSQTNIFNTTVPVTTTGKTAIPIGFTVAPGTGYRMHNVGSTAGGLFRNTGGAQYPYSSPALTITGAINTSTTFYYKFYDWHISTGAAPDPRVAATVTVNPNPTVDAGADLVFCGPGSAPVILSPTISGSAGPFQYLWTPSSGLNNDTIASPTAQPTADITYFLLATDQITGCKGQDSTTVQVSTPVVIGLTDTTACSGAAVQLCAPQNPGFDYTWSNGDTTACTNVSNAGSYSVVVVDDLGCPYSDTATLSQAFVPAAAASIDSSGCPTVQFNDLSTGIPGTWLWDFGNGDTAQSQNPTYTYASNGSYTVTLTASNQCGADTLTIPVTVSCLVGLQDELANDFRLYPNPGSGQFWLESNTSFQESVTLEILAADGRLVRSIPVNPSDFQNRLPIDLRTEAAGVYFLRLRNGDRQFRTVLVKRN